MTEVCDALYRVLADSYALYTKSHTYHWNVQGPMFQSLHEMFQLQYEDLAVAVDDVAERIRTLGTKVDGRWSAFSSITVIDEASMDASAHKMIVDLYQSHSAMNEGLKALFDVASERGDEVSADLAIQRMNIHQKAAWFLKSHLNE